MNREDASPSTRCPRTLRPAKWCALCRCRLPTSTSFPGAIRLINVGLVLRKVPFEVPGDGVVEVRSTAGDSHLGGDDFDHLRRI
ncbi:Hsp70 family protein [Streptomyces sp. NPDC051020]|uniref:Hsp70 family protein n=1 Tax=Streptomyces sp. NPDC051020 TaxID=3155409 RepID=UPI0034257F28